MNWYVIFVMGGKEEKICTFINQYEDVKAFIIKKEVVHKKQGVITVLEKPMFPSYIFVETGKKHQIFQSFLKEMRMQLEGIIKELKYEDEIPSLTKEERSYLEGLMNAEYIVKKSQGYMEDDQVVITEGPLRGYESRIKKIDRHQKKAIVDVDILGNTMEVTITLEIVRKI